MAQSYFIRFLLSNMHLWKTLLLFLLSCSVVFFELDSLVADYLFELLSEKWRGGAVWRDYHEVIFYAVCVLWCFGIIMLIRAMVT